MFKNIQLKIFVPAVLMLGLFALFAKPGWTAAPPPAEPPITGNLIAAQSAQFVVVYNPPGGCVTNDLPNFLPPGDPVAWPGDAKIAFEYAMSIWDDLLITNQTITIHACWLDLNPPIPGRLGSGQPVSALSNFTNAPQADTLYPVALANQLEQMDLNDADPEIIIAFSNSSSIDWYYGTDANPGVGQTDLVTVALHEMAHGLGMISTFFVNNGVDMCGTGNASDNQGCWGKDGPTTPGNTFNDQYAIFDTFVENNVPQTLTSFANPSTALGSQLTGGAVYFNGPQASAENGGPVRLYAPGSFDTASSILHLDQTTYENTSNRLMTSTYAGAQHHPGPIVLGMFEDMGWAVVHSRVYLPIILSGTD